MGVDGGGTNCRVRVATPDGISIGEATGGSANAFTDFEGAIGTVVETVAAALGGAGLPREAFGVCDVALGLAGANIPAVAAAFERRELPFRRSRLVSDVVVACLGAHRGRDGGLAIIGTGTSFIARRGGRSTIFSAWGLAVSDHGSGGDLGRSALGAALLAHDRVGPSSELTDVVLAEFDRDPARIAGFALEARPRDFGRFAPMVFDWADRGDPVAVRIVANALSMVEASLGRLADLGVPSIVLSGGVAERYRPRLADRFQTLLAEAEGTALDGAILLAREIAAQ